MKTLHQLHTENRELEVMRIRTTYTGSDKITAPCTLVVTVVNNGDFELTNYVDGCPRSITLTYDSIEEVTQAIEDYNYMERAAIKRGES